MSTARQRKPRWMRGRSSTFHLRPKKLSERHGSTAAAESLQDGHSGRSVGAEINYTKCQHTGPSFEAKISRSPALSCPTATCSRQPAPSSQNPRREDGPMSLPPEALELMSYDPLLGRCRKPRDSACAKPDSAQQQQGGPVDVHKPVEATAIKPNEAANNTEPVAPWRDFLGAARTTELLARVTELAAPLFSRRAPPLKPT
jgi:hypothetical protein